MALQLFGDFGFAAGSDETAARYQDAQRCINFYPEISPSAAAKGPVALLGCPGLLQVGAAPGGGAPGIAQTLVPWTADSGIPVDSALITADGMIVSYAWPAPSSITNLPVRGMWTLPGRQKALVVVSSVCYLVTLGPIASNGFPSLILTAVGDLATNSGPVCIRENGIQGGAAVIVDGPNGYIYQLSGAPSVVTATGQVTPNSAVVTSTTLSGLVIGSAVTDSGALVPAGTTLLSVDIYGGTFTLSNPISGSSPLTYPTTSAAGTAVTTAVTNVSSSGGIATLQFAAQPSAPPIGSSFAIIGSPISSYNGTFTVVASGTTYVSYATGSPPPGRLTGSLKVTLPGTATIGFAVVGTAPPVGGNVTIAGVTPSAYNGSYVIAASSTTSVSFVSLASGSQATAGTASWVGPTSDTFTFTTPAWMQIQDPAFYGADTVAFIDGWWIFNKPGTAEFYTNSAPYSTAFNATYYAFKDAFSDSLVAVIENKEELWLIGEETTEIWYDAGGPYFPFQRLVGTLIQMGCAAKHSPCQLSSGGTDSLIWLGRNVQGENVIVRTSGFAWDVVSTPAVSHAIARYATIADAIGYVYQEDAHEFYVLTFPTADRTWVYDSTLPAQYAWHERRSYDPYAAEWHRHRSNCYMQFAGMRLVGDYQNGAIYQLTRNAYTDAGWPLRAVRRSPYVWSAQDRERVFMSQLQVDFQLGQGNASGLGVNPKANLRISRDYGSTYGSAVTAPMGAQGQYTNRCIWRRLGFSRGAVLEVEVIDPVNRDIVGVTLRANAP